MSDPFDVVRHRHVSSEATRLDIEGIGCGRRPRLVEVDHGDGTGAASSRLLREGCSDPARSAGHHDESTAHREAGT